LPRLLLPGSTVLPFAMLLLMMIIGMMMTTITTTSFSVP